MDAGKIIFGALLVFGTILLYTFEIPHWQNTLQLRALLITAVLAGAFLGAIAGFLLGKNRTEYLEKFQIFIAGLVLGIVLMPLLLSLSNRLGSSQPVTEQMELIKVETYAGSRFGIPADGELKPDGYRVFLLRGTEVLRLQKKENPFPDVEKGAQVDVPVRRGLWGFEFVDW